MYKCFRQCQFSQLRWSMCKVRQSAIGLLDKNETVWEVDTLNTPNGCQETKKIYLLSTYFYHCQYEKNKCFKKTS